MNNYFDIYAIPNAELTQNVVIGHLMQCLHQYLPDFCEKVGLGFPQYAIDRGLGGVIQVFGDSNKLEELYSRLEYDLNFSNHAILGKLQAIPQKVNYYVCYKRVQIHGNSYYSRSKRRHQERGAELQSLNLKHLINFNKLPYVNLSSSSTGQNFKLFIKQVVTTKMSVGTFNSYGLSSDGATVPKF